jgi:large subunit ribosomal protein L14e
MTLYEVGRICVKTMGREAGSYCVIVEAKNAKTVLITGPKSINGVRRRSCNTRHLEPLDSMLDIKAGADDSAVEKALEDAELLEKFRTRIRINM